MSSRFSFVVLALAVATGCEAPEDDFGDVAVNAEGKEDRSLSLRIRKSGYSRFSFTTSGAPVKVTVDCGPSADPDSVGPAFSVYAPDLGIASSSQEPPKAGFWRWSGKVASGSHYVTLNNRGSSQASCRVVVANLSSSAACTSRTEHRSTVTGHNHYAIGTELSSRWETLPVSGDHFPVWADWNTIYDRPVKTGHVLHNLEHGGLVLSYNCSSVDESEECAESEAKLISLVNSFRQRRVFVTPDPTQPTRFAIRGWRWGYQAECFDAASALEFMRSHFRHGREDIEDNSGVDFDPTY